MNTDMLWRQQHQEAQDLQISLTQRHRPKVPKKPQARTPRNHESAEGGQGGEEGYCIGEVTVKFYEIPDFQMRRAVETSGSRFDTISIRHDSAQWEMVDSAESQRAR